MRADLHQHNKIWEDDYTYVLTPYQIEGASAERMANPVRVRKNKFEKITKRLWRKYGGLVRSAGLVYLGYKIHQWFNPSSNKSSAV